MDVELELLARKAAMSACAFMADGEKELAATTLAVYMRDADRAGHCLVHVLHALSGALLHVVVAANIDAEVFRAMAADLMLLEDS